MSFATAVNCMDGRTQIPVIEYVRQHLGVEYVDMVTEAGPVRTAADSLHGALAASIIERVEVSVEEHESRGIAIVAHHDCAGNPVADDVQLDQIKEAAAYLHERFPHLPVFGLWVDDGWSVTEVCSFEASDTDEFERS